MDFKCTFEDGSEAIAHYGVLGMKWGVWNAETRARRDGSKADNLVSKRKKAYDNAELNYSHHGWKGPIRKKVTKTLRDRALNRYADSVIKANNPENAKARKAERQKEELAADKRLGKEYSEYKGRPGGFNHDEVFKYYSTISKIEMGRAIDKAIPKGREEVKKVLQWGHETSAKTDAAIGGVPIKTRAEAKKYRSLNSQYDEARIELDNNPTPENQKKFDRIISDNLKFDENQRKKYFY